MTQRPKQHGTPAKHKKDWLSLVFNDKDFTDLIKQMQAVPPDEYSGVYRMTDLHVERICRKFKIDPSDIGIYMKDKIIHLDNIFDKAHLQIDLDNKQASINFDLDARQKDIIKSFKQFESIRNHTFPMKLSRENQRINKPLVLAISKAKYKSSTNDVLEMLKSRTLPGFEGKKSNISTLNELNNFMYKNGIN